MQEAGVAAGAGRLQHEDLLHDVRIEGAVPCLVIGGGGLRLGEDIIFCHSSRQLCHLSAVIQKKINVNV